MGQPGPGWMEGGRCTGHCGVVLEQQGMVVRQVDIRSLASIGRAHLVLEQLMAQLGG